MTVSARPVVLAIVQARMGSTRLPGKVLADLGRGTTLLAYLLQRLQTSETVSKCVVATSLSAMDDCLVEAVSSLGYEVYRGSESDVLDRYYQTASLYGADVIVRLTADNPLVDGKFVDRCVRLFLSADPPLDYADTTTTDTFPYGMSVEVISFAVLSRIWKQARDRDHREHVTLYIRQNAAAFRVKHISDTQNNADLRWTIDTPDDLQKIRSLFEQAGPDGLPESYDALLRYVRSLHA